jgi:hypothetical protein
MVFPFWTFFKRQILSPTSLYHHISPYHLTYPAMFKLRKYSLMYFDQPRLSRMATHFGTIYKQTLSSSHFINVDIIIIDILLRIMSNNYLHSQWTSNKHNFHCALHSHQWLSPRSRYPLQPIAYHPHFLYLRCNTNYGCQFMLSLSVHVELTPIYMVIISLHVISTHTQLGTTSYEILATYSLRTLDG